MKLRVDNETFSVTEREPGTYDLIWESGPHDGYGFSVAHSDAQVISEERLEALARNFLGTIDPSTGYPST